MKVRSLMQSMLITLLLFVSCGDKKTELTALDKELSGPLSGYYQVVDKPYKINDKDIIGITIRRTAESLPFDPDNTDSYAIIRTAHSGESQVGLGITIFDKDENVIDIIQATAKGLSGVYSSDDIDALIQLKQGETTTVRWRINAASDSKPVYFKITSAMKQWGKASDASGESLDDSVEKTFVEVTGEHVRIRLSPSTDGMILLDNNGSPIYPDKGEYIECTGEEDDFYRILFHGRDAYISKQFSRTVSGKVSAEKAASENSIESNSYQYRDSEVQEDVQSSEIKSNKLLSQYLTLVRKIAEAEYHNDNKALDRLENEAELLEDKLDNLELTDDQDKIVDELYAIRTETILDGEKYNLMKRQLNEIETKLCENPVSHSGQVSTTKKSKTNWDKFLIEYEKYVDEYVALLKKANNGDISAMASAMSLLQKAQSLTEKLEAAEGEMTPKQLLKYEQISMKMLNAMPQ